MKDRTEAKEVISLTEYIQRHFDGSQVDFAAKQGVAKQQVTQWISKDFLVIDDVLYSARRELNRKL